MRRFVVEWRYLWEDDRQAVFTDKKEARRFAKAVKKNCPEYFKFTVEGDDDDDSEYGTAGWTAPYLSDYEY